MGQNNIKQKFSALEPIEVPNTENKFWKLYEGITANTQHAVSVFEFEKTIDKQQPVEGENKILLECAQNALRTVKQLRHPLILKYVDYIEIAPGHFMLVTEPVTPLRKIIHRLECSEIITGLYQVAKALHWLHSNKIIHNNVQLDSIYVTRDKHTRWVLGDFQFIQNYEKFSPDFLQDTKPLRSAITITPEEGLKDYPKQKIYCRDVWGLSKFISVIYNLITAMKEKSSDAQYEELHRGFHKFFTSPDVKRWLIEACQSDPNKRASLKAFLKLKSFKEDFFLQTTLLFDDIQMKPTSEKEAFFRNFYTNIQKIPLSLIKKRLVPRMLTLPFMIEPTTAPFLPYLLSPQPKQKDNTFKYSGLFDDDDYKAFVLPFLARSFNSRNRSLRVKLLQTLEYYIWTLNPETVQKTLVDEIMIGLLDTNDDLVMSSMDAIVVLSNYLSRLDAKTNSQNGINIVNSKFVAKLHHYAVSNESDAIRSHAILCATKLWNIQKVHKNVILSAIEHGLYDKKSFEMKLYTLNVILMHLTTFDPRELVGVILKMVVPLTLHEKKEVRVKATQVITNALNYVSEMDVTNCNLGNVSSDDKKLSFIKGLYTVFPLDSTYPLTRTPQFQGSGPKVVYKVNESDEESVVKETVVKKKVSQKTKPIQSESMEEMKEQKESKFNEITSEPVKWTKSTSVSMNNMPISEEDWENWDGETPLQKSEPPPPKITPLKIKKIERREEPKKLRKPIIKKIGRKKTKPGDEGKDEENDSIPEENLFEKLGMLKEIKKEPKKSKLDVEEEIPENVTWGNIDLNEEIEERRDEPKVKKEESPRSPKVKTPKSPKSPKVKEEVKSEDDGSEERQSPKKEKPKKKKKNAKFD